MVHGSCFFLFFVFKDIPIVDDMSVTYNSLQWRHLSPWVWCLKSSRTKLLFPATCSEDIKRTLKLCTADHFWRKCTSHSLHKWPAWRNPFPCRDVIMPYYSVHFILTHWGRDKMDAISQTTFSRAFSSMKIVVFWLNFHWNMFARVQLTIIQHWIR